MQVYHESRPLTLEFYPFIQFSVTHLLAQEPANAKDTTVHHSSHVQGKHIEEEVRVIDHHRRWRSYKTTAKVEFFVESRELVNPVFFAKYDSLDVKDCTQQDNHHRGSGNGT